MRSTSTGCDRPGLLTSRSAGEGFEFWDESEKVTYSNTASFKVTARKPA